ncbi:hypothetical protein GXB78_23975 [Pseudomonas moraviensis subsp. stanleyae]|uniref:hypothetical protein n=1 Tax=Pseudomonas moraviensis TaxID=321662 RepID=UPI002E313A26|nr:hypothetical protein [Pseudomonas moraviensis]MED7670267.1 hypothetical protein [Pseudomonas moraviensis subsp. stanleyae]
MNRRKSAESKRPQKIRKRGPFDLSVVSEKYPYFSHLLVNAISQLEELPDFSGDDKVAVMSDFGGEHHDAHFTTYAFLIFAYNKAGPFIEQVEKLRRKHKILEPYSEFKFKDLKFGPRSRALPDFLHAIDNFIHGSLITVAIERKIETVFGPSKKVAHPFIEEQLSSLGLGNWKGETGEKALRICHSIAMFVALMTHENQRLLWYCDNDSINENGQERSFGDTQKLFSHTLGMYCKHKFDLIGFGKSFEKKSHLDDLLSVPDFAAGIIHDVLKSHHTGEDNIPGFPKKEILIKWLANESRFLSKTTIQISKLPNGDIGSGIVKFTPAKTK